MAEVWLKALSWAKVGPGWSVMLSNSTALQARPWALQPAYWAEKSPVAVEVTVTSTESSSLWASVALAPTETSRAIRLAGSRASNGASAWAAGLVGAGAAAAAAGLGAAGLRAAPVARSATATRAMVFRNMPRRYQTWPPGASAAFARRLGAPRAAGFRGAGPRPWLSSPKG